jgi:hypothetical protein
MDLSIDAECVIGYYWVLDMAGEYIPAFIPYLAGRQVYYSFIR